MSVGPAGLELVEIAPGIELERDVLPHMAFKPVISSELKTMDARLFSPEPMGLKHDVLNRNPELRTPRRKLAARPRLRATEPA